MNIEFDNLGGDERAEIKFTICDGQYEVTLAAMRGDSNIYFGIRDPEETIVWFNAWLSADDADKIRSGIEQLQIWTNS